MYHRTKVKKMWKNGHTLKILQCSPCSILKVCLAIFQNYTWKLTRDLAISWLTLYVSTLQNVQTLKQFGGCCRQIVWVCLTILCLLCYLIALNSFINHHGFFHTKINVSIIWKPINWFVEQINRPVFIWWKHWSIHRFFFIRILFVRVTSLKIVKNLRISWESRSRSLIW